MELQDLKIDRGAGSSKGSRRRGNSWFGKTAVLLGVAALVWIFWAPLTRWVDTYRLPTVKTTKVSKTNPAAVGAIRGAASNGYVVAARRAALSADTPGRIVEMHVTEGSVVREGDLVARLYPDEFAAAVARAEADLEAAQAEVLRTRAQIASAKSFAELAQRNAEAATADVRDAEAAETFAAARLSREQQLLADGIASEDSLQERKERADRTRAQRIAAEARVEAATANAADATHRITVAEASATGAVAMVGIREAAIAQAKATLAKTDVRAPFDGVVVLKDAEIGEVVSPNSQGGSNARGSVCTLVDFDSLEVEADVQETTIAQVDIGMPATVFLDAFPEDPYPGTVSRIWPTADRQKGTIEVRVTFAKRDERLRPDMGVRVVFATAETEKKPEGDTPREPELVIPADCVIRSAGVPTSETTSKALSDAASGEMESGGREAGDAVFVLERDTVRLVRVTLGPERSGRVVVTNGLRIGQDVVLDPPASLSDGDRVQIAR